MNWKDQLEDMFGERWTSIFSSMSGINRRTVLHWRFGKYDIPIEVEDKINATYEIWND